MPQHLPKCWVHGDYKKILFICKRGQIYNLYGYGNIACGLLNSVRFIADAINESGGNATAIEVTDNNDIDRMVSFYRPDVVVIEALWVVPEKFSVLMELYPHVDWYVHLHSNMPFLASEGIMAEWLPGYARRGVKTIVNSRKCLNAVYEIIGSDNVLFLPNVYPTDDYAAPKGWQDYNVLRVGCFGAIRPMKNQLAQAIAAIALARDLDVILKFYINGSRVEGGDAMLKNLRALFKIRYGTILIEEPWRGHDDFLKLAGTMDISLQVSMSETFNIVMADSVAMGVPVVGSPEIPWLSRFSQADPSDASDIEDKMRRALKFPYLVKLNQYYLREAARQALRDWLSFLRRK